MKQNYAISRHLFVLMIVGFITVLHLPAAASQTARVPMVPQNFTGLVDTVSPAVVHIRVEKTVEAGGQASGPFSKHPFGGDQGSKDFFGHRSGPRQRPEFKRPGQGSGFSQIFVRLPRPTIESFAPRFQGWFCNRLAF